MEALKAICAAAACPVARRRISIQRGAIFAATVLLFAACETIQPPRVQRVREPDPALSPVEVVEAQLDALRPARDDAEGIEVVYNFASPANRERTGSIEDFRILFENPLYAPLLNPREFEVYASSVFEHLAVVPVRVIASNGDQVDYVFILTRQQEEPYETMWMTDSIQIHSPHDEDSEVSYG